MKRGFSTLEIIIAMAVLMSAFSVVILLSSTSALSVDSRTSSEALTLARKALETEQSLARKDFKLVVATTSNETLANVTYTKTVVVSPVDLFTKKVSATVTWLGTYGRNPSTTLTSLITNFQNATGGDTCSTILTDSAGAHSNWKVLQTVDKRLGQDIVGDSTGLYPITDIDVYQKRLYATVSTASVTVGPNNPAAAALDASVGTVAWGSIANVKANDAAYSTATISSGQITNYAKATGFGFIIPQGSAILGIKAEVERKGSSSTNTVKDYRVRIARPDGTIGAYPQEHTTSWPTTEAYDTYGSASDLWGELELTPTMVNNPNFGIAVSATTNSGSSSRTASIDHVRVTVYYTRQFYILDVSANPASPTYLGSLGTSTFPGGLNALVVATSSTNHVAYVATNSGTGLGQLQIIDVKDPSSPFVKATFPAGAGTGMGKGVGTSIFYKDGYIYEGLTTGAGGPEFNIIDTTKVLSDPTHAWVGGYSVGAAVNAIVVKDGYAYLSTNDTSKELVVLDITNPASPSLVSAYNALPDNGATFGYGRALSVVGDTAYLGRSWIGSLANAPEFSAINASVVPFTVSTTTDVGPNTTNPFSVNGLVIRDYLEFLLLGSATSGGKLQVINANTGSTWSATLPSGASSAGGVSLDCEGNYMYAASVDTASKGWISSFTGS